MREFRNVVQPDFTCRTDITSPERQNTHTHTHTHTVHNNVFVQEQKSPASSM